MDEGQAIARLKQGDIGGLEPLVRKYQVRAMRAAYLITGDGATAEDIVQEAFLRAFERIDQFDSRRPFGPWFLRSVVNDAVKTAVRQKRQVSADEIGEEGMDPAELAVDPNPGPEEWLERIELSEAVGEALQRLSPPRRAAIVFRYYLGLTEPEIARRLRWPLGTMKRRLHDARRHLRALMAAVLLHQADGGTLRHETQAEPGHAASGMEAGGKP